MSYDEIGRELHIPRRIEVGYWCDHRVFQYGLGGHFRWAVYINNLSYFCKPGTSISSFNIVFKSVNPKESSDSHSHDDAYKSGTFLQICSYTNIQPSNQIK